MDSSMQISKKYEMDCQCLHCFISVNHPAGSDASSQQKLLEILTSRSLDEMKLIRQLYSAIYNQLLLQLLGSTRRNNALTKVAYLRLSEPHVRDAEIIKDVLFGARVDLNTLIEVICTRSSVEIHSVKQGYRSLYGSDIDQDVSVKVQGGFKEILLALLRSSRHYASRVDMSMAMCDAKTIYEAMESGKALDQKTILSLTSQRSTVQFRAVLESYKQLYGSDLSKSLKRNKCGQFGKDLRVVIRCVQYPEKYFTKKLRRSVNTFDAQEALIRIIITRSGIDLKDIKTTFGKKAGFSLENLVRREFNNSGNRNNKTTEKANGLAAQVLVQVVNRS